VERNRIPGDPSAGGEGAVDGAAFAAFAGDDLDRWREILGRRVVHRHAGWGSGVVEDVIWDAPVDRIAPSVHVRARYETGLRASIDAHAFGEMHVRVSIPAELAALLAALDANAAPPDERESRFAEYTQAARERRDQERLERIGRIRKGRGRT